MNASVRLQVNYIAPTNVGAVATMNAALEYVGSAAGFVDIPEAAVDGTSYVVPFGTVAAAKLAVIQNNTDQNLEVAINGTEDVFILPPGGVCMPSCASGNGITGLTVTTTATMTADGTVSYIVLGDTATP